MTKICNKNLIKMLSFVPVILLITTFSLSMPEQVNAQVNGYVTPYGGTNYNNYNGNYYNNYNNPYYYPNNNPYYYQTYNQVPVYVPPQSQPSASTPIDNYAVNSSVNSSSDAVRSKNVTVSKTNTEKNTTDVKNTANINTSDTSIDSLAANVIFGTNSFAPSGIIQWILVAILILVIIILFRKIAGGENKYRSTPLKHG